MQLLPVVGPLQVLSFFCTPRSRMFNIQHHTSFFKLDPIERLLDAL